MSTFIYNVCICISIYLSIYLYIYILNLDICMYIIIVSLHISFPVSVSLRRALFLPFFSFFPFFFFFFFCSLNPFFYFFFFFHPFPLFLISLYSSLELLQFSLVFNNVIICGVEIKFLVQFLSETLKTWDNYMTYLMFFDEVPIKHTLNILLIEI